MMPETLEALGVLGNAVRAMLDNAAGPVEIIDADGSVDLLFPSFQAGKSTLTIEGAAASAGELRTYIGGEIISDLASHCRALKMAEALVYCGYGEGSARSVRRLSERPSRVVKAWGSAYGEPRPPKSLKREKRAAQRKARKIMRAHRK
jgi:hypothetical protein